MKKIFIMLVVSALIFTSCNKPEIEQETSVPAETVSEEITTTAETEKTASDTEITTVSETETTTSVAKIPEHECPKPIIPPEAVSVDICSFYEGLNYDKSVSVVDENNICVMYEFSDRAELRFFGTADGEEKAHITLPESESGHYILRYGKAYGEDILCMVYSCGKYENGHNNYKANFVTSVYKDYSFETEDERRHLLLPGGGKMLVGNRVLFQSSFNNIYAEGNELILNSVFEGFESKSSQFYRLCFAIDDDSFVYDVLGWEWTCCFGIYDFRTGTARDVPNTINFSPIGVRSGKVYSYKWDFGGSDDNNVYVTDINTLETKPLFEVEEYVESLSMPENGEFIMAYDYLDNSDTLMIRLYDPDSGEVIKEYMFKNTFGYYYYPQLIGSSAAVVSSSKGDEMYILDLSL